MIVLDTHVWLWWMQEPSRLSTAARDAIDEAAEILISAISCMEATALTRRDRIRLDRDPTAWVVNALAEPRVQGVPVDASIAARAGSLPHPFPGDPADRLIYATACARGVRLVTRDRAIRQFDPLRTVW